MQTAEKLGTTQLAEANEQRRARVSRQLDEQRFVVAVVLLSCVLTAIAYGVLVQRANIIRLTYQRENLEKQYVQEVDENKRLNLLLAKLRSPERIEQEAVALGFVWPKEREVLVLTPEKEHPSAIYQTRNTFASEQGQQGAGLWSRLKAGVEELLSSFGGRSALAGDMSKAN